MSEPESGELLTVGRITGCYGIKGWVKIHSYTEPRDNFLTFGEWWVRRRGALEPVEFDQGRCHGKGLVVHIEGVNDRNLAEAYRGLEVLAPASRLPRLEQGDYYWHQLEGLQVWCGDSKSRVLLGAVDYLIETGANDVLVIKPTEGSIDDRERLIPYLPGDVVTRVDLEQGELEVDWFPNE
jgi:16S rRNA processing protein RimM